MQSWHIITFCANGPGKSARFEKEEDAIFLITYFRRNVVLKYKVSFMLHIAVYYTTLCL